MRCPKCNADLDYVVGVGTAVIKYALYLKRDGSVDKEIIVDGDLLRLDDVRIDEYWCPECGETIATDLDELKEVVA